MRNFEGGTGFDLGLVIALCFLSEVQKEAPGVLMFHERTDYVFD